MAKPLLVRTERSPTRRMPLSGSGGNVQIVTTSAQVPIHVVPDGYRDEIYVWVNNNDAANDGQFLIEFDGVATKAIIGVTPNREILDPFLEGMVIEARGDDVVIDGLAITEPCLVWGYVIRTAIDE